ncbi:MULTISPECIES: hypothetical protein [unclassified Rickettsia]|uniref:hypothetical protein n=1 Tax=unclassified Rickettsia TaxID=114295 RepID=UPI003132A58A
MAHNLLYYGYYKYGVMPWLDHGIQSFTKIFSGYRGQAGVVAWIRNCHKKGVILAKGGNLEKL